MRSEVIIKNIRNGRQQLIDSCRWFGQALLDTADRLEDARKVGDLHGRFQSAGELQGNGIDVMCGELAAMLRVLEREDNALLLETEN
jgi:hypothetical protein